MAKLLILLAAFVFVQLSYARDVAEVLNDSIRQQLNLYDKFQKDADSANFANDLKKLVELTEGALKAAAYDEKNQILTSAPSKFSPEFNSWLNLKLEESQINSDILAATEFYKNLLADHPEHEAEIKKVLTTLENLLKESNLKQREEQFLSLDKSFSADFQKFLKENDLPNVNKRLQTTAEFFGKLLNEKDVKFAQDIQALKAKTEAVLGNNVSVDDKNKVLQEVSVTSNQQLNEYLQAKNIEYS